MGLLLVRADAGPRVGMGHAMRCLALAQAWRARGGSARFLMADPPPSLQDPLAAEGVVLESLGEEPGSLRDAAATAERARRLGVEALVVDGYAFGPAYRAAAREGGAPMLVVDDLGGDERWEADVILNQNLHARASMYADRPPGADLLLGPSFALLRSEIRSAAALRPEDRAAEPVRTLLVMFGGADPVDATGQFLPAVANLDPEVAVRVLVGPANPRRATLARLAGETAGRLEVVEAGPDHPYPRLLADADLVVTAAGSTCWELCFLGIPFVTVVLADNQAAIAASLQEAGASIDLGPHGEAESAALAKMLERLLADSGLRRAMGRAGRSLVDGRGAERVAGRIAKRRAA